MPPVTRDGIEAIITEALGCPRSLGNATICRNRPLPDYRRRIRTEMIAMIPGAKVLLRRDLVRWWVRMVRYWASQITVEEMDHAVGLMVEKNRIYGNNQIHALGTLGILIRSYDKIERIRNIDAGLRSHLLASESRKDSVIDNFNYAILAVLLLRGQL